MNAAAKILYPLITAIIVINASYAQGPGWEQSTQWTLYNLKGTKFWKVSLDSLANYPSRPLNSDSMRLFLARATLISDGQPPVWMGARVASCIIRGKRRKIDISTYGGFFFDESEKRFYDIPPGMQTDWLNYLANCAGALPSSK